MILTNLNPKQYKRFFAFGCSFTNYAWPTWADIIGQDIPVYENWGARGGGNHFIFNSVVEAHTRHNFTKDDLVIIMWSSVSREDRYNNGKWLHATIDHQEEIYGTEWLKRFAVDARSHLVHDLAYIKSTQVLLNSTGCDWTNFVMHPIIKANPKRANALASLFKTENDRRVKWYDTWEQLCAGNNVDMSIIDNADIIELYKDVFLNISASYECIDSYKARRWDLTPVTKPDEAVNPHPTPLQALAFLDRVYPNNSLSTNAREYAQYWENEIYKDNDWSRPIHKDPTINRL